MVGKVATFRIPAQITCGCGAADTVGGEAKRLGGTRGFLIGDPNLMKLGVPERMQAALKAEGIEARLFTEVEPEPSVGSVEVAAAAAREFRCDLVVAVGGGSALDTAKAVALLTRNPGTLEDYFGIGLVKQRGVPSILIPTTSGTGAEITPNSLFYVPALKEKKAVVSPYTIPDVAIIDPLLTLSVPAQGDGGHRDGRPEPRGGGLHLAERVPHDRPVRVRGNPTDRRTSPDGGGQR